MPSAPPDRDGVAPIAPVLRHADGLGPRRLEVGAGRAVEERLLQLTPATLEPNPREQGAGLGRLARDRPHDGSDLEARSRRVVAADTLLGRAAEIERRLEEVRVRPGRRVHDRVRPVDELELLLAPRRLLRSLVLAVADGNRLARERLTRVAGVEEELDVLPVAFVGVVPVVEDVVEPVLQGELTRVAGVGGDVRIDGRRRPFGDAVRPALVVAARVEGVPGEVEVVLVEVRATDRPPSGRP